MPLRNGLTASEEHKLKLLVAKGVTWEEIEARCRQVNERGQAQVPLFDNVDLPVIKKVMYLPLVKMQEEAKKAGFANILAHELDTRKKKEAAKAAQKSKNE